MNLINEAVEVIWRPRGTPRTRACLPRSLGIDVAPDGRVVSREGLAVDSLYYLGPWLRARDWEAAAVPELREHAAALADRLLSNLETVVKLPAVP